MKRNAWQRIFVAVIVFFCISGSQADESLSLYVENDSQLLKPNHNTDRHYTSGVKLVYGFQPDWQWLEDFGNWEFPFFPADSGDVTTAAGFFLGQHIYTPDRIDEPAKRDPKDMKYAGWLYTGLFVQRATENVMDQVELNVGVIGPSSKAEQSQNCIHNFFNSDEAIGWEDQLEDEPAADFSWMRRQRLTDGWLAPKDNLDFIAEYGFVAGSVNCNAQFGLMARYGFLNLPADFGPGRLSLPSGVLGRSASMEKSAYLYARASARAVAYNRFLTGLSHEPLMGEFQIGAVYQHKSLEIGYSQTFLTRQFEHQGGVDSYGTLTLTFHF